MKCIIFIINVNNRNITSARLFLREGLPPSEWRRRRSGVGREGRGEEWEESRVVKLQSGCKINEKKLN